MFAHQKLLFELTAGDLMCRNPLTVREGVPLRDAAELLIRASVHGVPVVDPAGRCVGVLSMTDLARWAAKPADPLAPPPGCSYQRHQPGLGGRADAVGRDPGAVPTDRQVVDLDALPADDVRHHMTADPVTVYEGADIRTIARLMTETEIHRVIVTDSFDHPVGVVSGSDLVAAVAYAPSRTRPRRPPPAASSRTHPHEP